MATITVDADITVKCDNCGASLDAEWFPHNGGHLDVAPCKICMEEALEKAEKTSYDEGYEKGFDDGEKEAKEEQA